MAYAPSSTYFVTGDGTVVGCFRHKETGAFFEYAANHDTEDFCAGKDWPHKVFVATANPGYESGYRYARVLKTVAHVVVDEDANGDPVVEKWPLKGHSVYPRPA